MTTEPLDAQAVKPAGPNAKKTRKVLVKKHKPKSNIKKYVWLAGHVLTLSLGGAYLFFYTVRWFLFKSWWWTPRICYRLSFVGVLMSYTITILTTFGSVVPSYHTLLATENFQNLILALIWLVSRPSAFKLIPYYAVALLHIANNFNIKPILNLQDPLSDAIATSEIVVIIALFIDTLLFRGTSGFALAIYLMFYWLRVNFSPYTQAYLYKIVQIVDEKVMTKQKPEVKAKWEKLKNFVEFRRSQTNKMYEQHLDHEPEVVDTAEHKDAGKVAQPGEELQVVGQKVEKIKGVPQGVIRPETAPASTPVKAAPQTSTAPATAKGTPQTNGTPSKHTLDPRQQLINSAQKVSASQAPAQQTAQTELQRLQQEAQAQYASAQR